MIVELFVPVDTPDQGGKIQRKPIATRFQAADLHETDFGKKALTILQECFQTYEHIGPVGWAVESQFEGDERIREMREAAGIVQEFVRLATEAPAP